APGEYHLKFIVRENQTGRMGSFETDITIPDLRKAPLRMSSVVLANQRVPASGASTKKGLHPLVQNQQELVPNITHVFTQDQHLYLQYEVYDVADQRKGGTGAASTNNAALDALLGTDSGVGANAAAAPQPKPGKDAVHVLTN